MLPHTISHASKYPHLTYLFSLNFAFNKIWKQAFGLEKSLNFPNFWLLHLITAVSNLFLAILGEECPKDCSLHQKTSECSGIPAKSHTLGAVMGLLCASWASLQNPREPFPIPCAPQVQLVLLEQSRHSRGRVLSLHFQPPNSLVPLPAAVVSWGVGTGWWNGSVGLEKGCERISWGWQCAFPLALCSSITWGCTHPCCNLICI